MRLTPRCHVGNALNDLFCVPKQMGAEIPSAEQNGGTACALTPRLITERDRPIG